MATTTQHITWIGPETITKDIQGSEMRLHLDFKDGRGPQPITIEKGDGFYMWRDHNYNMHRRFTTAEGLRWEFELEHQIAADLEAMEAGNPDQTTRINMNDAMAYYQQMMMMDFLNSTKNKGTNMTPKKKKRKK